MKRIQDKIKDFVEPQAYDEVHDFAADPARALAAYRFTDATADLLARWLDALADLPRGRGAAHALAGLRGVGKSHTLGVFGALVGSANLRASVSDAHVATSARRLASRRHAVVRVERGSRKTFGEELSAALVKALGGHPSEWSGTPADALAKAVSRAQGATVVLVVDTAYGRESRVARDDGPVLGALAVAARSVDAFIALALDDDIAGAEGVNVALSQTYRIDYLEPEHLYHVANNYLLRKSPPARDRLHEIYLALRSSVPNFNWSEPRFSALYPVHPLIADVAASVRLHAHSFAFLPFAAAASLRAINRPALSLVLLDEVFDQTERDLRTAKDLQDAFVVYDELASKAISQFPALQRLQVRLILKNLFVMSLDGRGATARDLCAALLLEDDGGAQPVAERVEDVLRRLAEFAPHGGLCKTADGGEDCYRFQLSASGGLDAALSRAVKLPLADARAIPELIAGLARARFDDWPLADAQASHANNAAAPPPDATQQTAATSQLTNSPQSSVQSSVSSQADGGAEQSKRGAGEGADFFVEWRGTRRAGRLTRMRAGDGGATPDVAGCDWCEWQVFVLEPGADGAAMAEQVIDAASAAARYSQQGSASSSATPSSVVAPFTVVWQPAELTAEEWGLLRRLHALRTEPALAGFGDAARAAAGSLTARAERVWSRLYVDDGLLLIDGERFRFTPDARSAPTLAGVLSQVLAPLFNERHPQHPQFAAPLCEQDVARLVENFFSGSNTADADVQQLAERFAHPLGLAAVRGTAFTPAAGDDATGRAWAREVLALVERAGNQTVPAAEVQRALSRPPSGLTAESRQLVLAALVAARRIELVTSTGDRISRRTLGRAINWSDVAGVSRPANVRHSAEELTDWARRLTGRADLRVIEDDAAREAARTALAAWLQAWRERALLEEFDALPDAGLTTRTWKLAAAVRRTFESAADAVESAARTDASLEEVLQRVADTFSASAEEFARADEQLASLAAYASGVGERERARAYLTAAEPTGVGEIESARRELLAIADDPHTLLDPDSRARFDLLWRAFRERYGALYAEAHERAAGQSAEHASALEELTRSEDWREFETLAQAEFVDPRPWREAAALLSRASDASCRLPVARLLEDRPRCACRFRLAEAEEIEGSAALLAALASRGREAYRRSLAAFHAHLAPALERLAAGDADEAVVARARSLANSFALGRNPPRLAPADVALCERALRASGTPQVLRVAPPPPHAGTLTRGELAARLSRWLEEVPHGPALFEIAAETKPNAAAGGTGTN